MRERIAYLTPVLAFLALTVSAVSFGKEPLFFDLDQFVLVAEDTIHFAEDVQVSSGDLASNKEIRLSEDVLVSGNLFSDEIRLAERSTVNGSTTSNKLRLAEDASVLGEQTPSISLPVVKLPEIPDFEPGTQDLKFKGSDNTLAPGSYGKVTLEEDSRLVLSGGTYNLSILILKGNSTLIYDAPSTLNIQEELKGSQGVSILPGQNLAPDDLLIHYKGVKEKKDDDEEEEDGEEENDRDNKKGEPAQFGENSFLNFKLIAPSVRAYLGEASTLRGQIFAEEIKVGGQSTLSKKEAFAKPSDPANIVVDQGTAFIGNELIVLVTDNASLWDVQQLAELVSGKVTGFVPNPPIYKIELPTNTAEETNVALQVIKDLSNPLVIEVVPNLIGQ